MTKIKGRYKSASKIIIHQLDKSMKASAMKSLLLLLLSTGVLASSNWRRIVGGTAADAGEFPYQIALTLFKNHQCGGSIIESKTILLAAHCVGFYPASEMTVLAGSNSIDGEGGFSYNVESYTRHPEYIKWYNLNDIALVHLQSEITYNILVQPIALNTEFTGADENCVLSGWGLTSYPGQLSNKLLKVHLVTIANEDCRSIHAAENGRPIIDGQICTFTITGEGGCKGDSGGPLVSKGKQIGLLSWGELCARGFPDVFARVSFYIDWIKLNTNQ